jgi:hypothetical protein
LLIFDGGKKASLRTYRHRDGCANFSDGLKPKNQGFLLHARYTGVSYAWPFFPFQNYHTSNTTAGFALMTFMLQSPQEEAIPIDLSLRAYLYAYTCVHEMHHSFFEV